ncbi:phosphatase PAP2 family protein [Micromonospora cathayae]|uniref:Phosphatase PAP2 family protein n=1 Tax=Micromonospora cathayae TaxID=3028804 RepID=A0ABY7ZT71_9ACTN|nr:phosphatase PAP2 family protein [Micromonospora sp. HUAS 3]WDZ86225.1 phosphatase PAP2 family protein [Micromonospora sp. HUAS 3]
MRSDMVDVTAGVPGFSAEWYTDVVEFADGSPEPVQWFAAHFTEGSVVLLGLLLMAAAWRYFRGAPQAAGIGPPSARTTRHRAAALVAPVAVVLAYGLSEWFKTVVDQERPCRDLTDLVIVAGHCPPVGDWSFPSNHSTIAGALATGTVLLWPRLGLLAVPLALLAAASRVFVGVHYPHDVVGGVLLGALVVTALVLPLTGLPQRRSQHRDAPPSPIRKVVS